MEQKMVMNKYDLSVVIPSINPKSWVTAYNSVKESIGQYTFETIFVGPNIPDSSISSLPSAKFVMDYGSPIRAIQIGVIASEAKYVMVMSDDCRCIPGRLEKLISDMSDNYKDISICTYVEGENLYGPDHKKHFGKFYWYANYHDDLRCPGIPNDWKIGPIHIVRRDYLEELGGFDCRFETFSVSPHDFLFRAQRNGSVVTIPDYFVVDSDFVEGRTPATDFVIDAVYNHDLPLYKKLYSSTNYEPIKIDINNWKNQPTRWARRWKNATV